MRQVFGRWFDYLDISQSTSHPLHTLRLRVAAAAILLDNNYSIVSKINLKEKYRHSTNRSKVFE
jgi:hypothetical protein